MLKLILRIIFSVLLFYPSGLLASLALGRTAQNPLAWAAIFGIYASSLLVIWTTTVNWRKRVFAWGTGAAVAMGSGFVASALSSSFIYSAVAFAFIGISVSVVATLLVLGRLSGPLDWQERGPDENVMLLLGVFILVLLFWPAPYLLFPWLLASTVIIAVVYAILRSIEAVSTVMIVSLCAAGLVFLLGGVATISFVTEELYLNLLR